MMAIVVGQIESHANRGTNENITMALSLSKYEYFPPFIRQRNAKFILKNCQR